MNDRDGHQHHKWCTMTIRYRSLAILLTAISCSYSPAISKPTANLPKASSIQNTTLSNHAQSDLPMKRIDSLINCRQGAEARRLIDKVKPTASNKNFIHILRGLSYRCEREPELAVAEFDQCTSLVEGMPWITLIAGSYSQVERYDKAIEITNIAIAREPRADLYGNRAGFLCAMGKFAEAVPDYKKAAMQKDGSERDYLTAAADLLRRQRKTKAAVTVLDEGLYSKERISDGKYWLCRANCFAELKDWAKAAQSCGEGVRVAEMAIKRSKWAEEITLSSLLLKRADCFDHLGKKELAERDRKAHLKIGRSTEDIIIGSPKQAK
ncbi:hypothetical protein BH11CYA1_BH11CYA1_00330 [soil metagenome]